ncbi:MAG TPA: hypothetical protein VMB82_13495, partial [Acidimicrobiales bacterium]|nr:hypothetical protein [Acidimicrobiales bacterium]
MSPGDPPGARRDDGPARFDRRRLLRGTAAGALGVAIAASADPAGASRPRQPAEPKRASQFSRPGPSPVTQQTLTSGVSIPVARWLVQENEKPGTI